MKGRARGDKEGRRARRSREVETRDGNLDRRGLICAGAEQMSSARREGAQFPSAPLGPSACSCVDRVWYLSHGCRKQPDPLGSSQGNGIPLINPDKKSPQVLL